MKKFSACILFCFSILLLGGCLPKGGLPDMRESYSKKDTKPFGAYTAFDMLENCFPDNSIELTRLSFSQRFSSSSDTSSLYFCVSHNFFTTENEVNAILNYVYNGNTFFLAAANIDTLLLQKLYCKIQKPDIFSSLAPPFFKTTSVHLANEIASDSFSYYYVPFNNFFSELNDNYCRPIGYNNDGKTNCMVFFWGKGKIFLHADPRAFSNYFLLTHNNNAYLKELLQLLNPTPEHIYWNDYYCHHAYRDTRSSFSSLSEIFKYPPLKSAFWLCMFSLIAYILFNGKRRQAVIKQILPNQNSSVAFTETIARLYLQKKDNKNIADKMITYFNEYIRSHYFLYANAGSKEFVNALSRKSGVSLEKTTALYHAIDAAVNTDVIDDYQLLSLNGQIQEFYKKRK